MVVVAKRSFNMTVYRQIAADITEAMAQWVRALAPQAEGWVFETQPRQRVDHGCPVLQ